MIRHAACLGALVALPLAGQAPVRLTLDEAIARGRSQGVVAAVARTTAAVADRRMAQRRADLLPSVTVGGSWSRRTLNLDEFGIPFASGVTDPFSLWNVQVRGSQTLFDASAWTRFRAARDSAVAGGADARAVGELAAAQAGLAYLRALSALETVRAREADSVVAASLREQARALVAAGVSPAIDATRSEVQFATVLTQLEVARNQEGRARLDLARALDLPAATALELADGLDIAGGEPVTDPAAAVAFALAHRAELQAERGRSRVAAQALRAIRFEYLPSLALGGQYVQSGRTLGTLNGSWLVQLGVTIPVLDGLRRPARQQEQALRLEAQRLREHDVEQQVTTDVRQALLDRSSAEHQVELAGVRLALAERELAQASERFAAGVTGTLETTNAQGGLIAARDGLIQARVNAAVARVSLRRALGVLDQPQ
jgi:outer membrane protein TolC